MSVPTRKARDPRTTRCSKPIDDGLVDALVVYDLDRLHRHRRELEGFFEVCDSVKLRNIATVSGDVDLGTGHGRMVARMLGAAARHESDNTARRIVMKHAETAQQGKYHGGEEAIRLRTRWRHHS